MVVTDFSILFVTFVSLLQMTGSGFQSFPRILSKNLHCNFTVNLFLLILFSLLALESA